MKTFVIEINDLRGSDRNTFPKIILELTTSLSNLTNLECVEIGQKSGHTSCTFDDSDIENDQSVAFLRSFETLLHRNKQMKRINIFFPLHIIDMVKFADIAMSRIVGTGNDSLVNFY